MSSEDSDMSNAGSGDTTPTAPNFQGVAQPHQAPVPTYPYVHPVGANQENYARLPHQHTTPYGHFTPHPMGHPTHMGHFPFAYPYSSYPVMQGYPLPQQTHPNATVAQPPTDPSVAAGQPQARSSVAAGRDLQYFDRETSATPSETTGSTSDAETTTTAETDADTSRTRKRKRQDNAPADNAQAKGKGKSTEGDPSHDILDQQLQAQYLQISERLDRIAHNTQIQDVKPQQLTSSDNVLQQLLKGYQETNEILRGIGNQSKETQEVNGAMDVDSSAGGLANVKIRMAPVTRPQESRDLARVVRNYFKEVFQGHTEDRSQVNQYRLSQIPSCTIDEFRLDLEAPPNAAWNRSARNVFVTAITDQKAAELAAFKPTIKDLHRLFVSNFRNTRSKYRWAQKTKLEREVIKQEHRRAERKRWLYYRRIKAAERFQDTTRHIPMIAAYGDTRFKVNRRVTPGAHPHRRGRSSKLSKSAPVPKLPSGLYDPEWLSRQPDVVKEDLQITDNFEYDFSHTAAIEDISRVNHGKVDSVHPGDDSGQLIVTETQDIRNYDKFNFSESVTAILWTPDSQGLYVGLANCEVGYVSFHDQRLFRMDFRPEGYEDLPQQLKDLIQINCLSYDPVASHIGIGVGVTTIVISVPDFQKDVKYVEHCVITPANTTTDEASLKKHRKGLPMEVRSVHFTDNGQAMIVTYLQGGIWCFNLQDRSEKWRIQPASYRIIRGRSTIDSRGRVMVCSNLHNGFDVYNVREKRHIRTLPHEVHEDVNVPLPVAFIHDDTDVLCGTGCGEVSIRSVTTDSMIGLDHGEDMIQAVAFTQISGAMLYIATGCAEKEAATYVKLWARAPEQGLFFLLTASKGPDLCKSECRKPPEKAGVESSQY
ncbi:hypothetical protein H1R20_g12672, partial [Candolleomyces eurysporus]